MVRLAASKLDAGDADATVYCAMAKRLATDTGFEVCNQALQIHGGYGYLQDYPLERYLRDVRVHQILEGTNEIMRVIVARRMLQDHATETIRCVLRRTLASRSTSRARRPALRRGIRPAKAE